MIFLAGMSNNKAKYVLLADAEEAARVPGIVRRIFNHFKQFQVSDQKILAINVNYLQKLCFSQ